MNDIGRKFKIGLIWSVGGQFGYLLIGLLTNIILARLLTPKEFGIIAISTFFISLSKVLSESGLSGALIRKKNASELDNSTIFIFNLIISLILYGFLFIGSPAIEEFYQIDRLSTYIRVLGVILIINAFQIIQNVRLVKKLEYKSISTYSLISILSSSLIALILAYLGFGIWALILLQVFYALFLTILYWLKVERLKVFKFSRSSFKELYGFGMYTTLSSLLNTAFDNVYPLILGKYFSLNQTGFYFQAKKLVDIPVGVIKSSALGVVFSTLSNIQDDKMRFDAMYNNIIRIFTIIVGMICMGLFLFSKEIILLLYGSKWLAADFYMKVLALSSFFYMQEMFNRILFKVFNQTHKIFILEIVKKTINLISIFFGVVYKSIEILIFGYFITSIISYFINYYVSRSVYRSKAVFKEMIYTLKVVIAIILISIVYYFVHNTIVLDAPLHNLIYSLPMVGLYFLTLQILNVFNLRRDIGILKSLKQ